MHRQTLTNAKVLWSLLEQRVDDLLGGSSLDGQWSWGHFLADWLLAGLREEKTTSLINHRQHLVSAYYNYCIVISQFEAPHTLMSHYIQKQPPALRRGRSHVEITCHLVNGINKFSITAHNIAFFTHDCRRNYTVFTLLNLFTFLTTILY